MKKVDKIKKAFEKEADINILWSKENSNRYSSIIINFKEKYKIYIGYHDDIIIYLSNIKYLENSFEDTKKVYRILYKTEKVYTSFRKDYVSFSFYCFSGKMSKTNITWNLNEINRPLRKGSFIIDIFKDVILITNIRLPIDFRYPSKYSYKCFKLLKIFPTPSYGLLFSKSEKELEIKRYNKCTEIMIFHQKEEVIKMVSELPSIKNFMVKTFFDRILEKKCTKN